MLYEVSVVAQVFGIIDAVLRRQGGQGGDIVELLLSVSGSMRYCVVECLRMDVAGSFGIKPVL